MKNFVYYKDNMGQIFAFSNEAQYKKAAQEEKDIGTNTTEPFFIPNEVMVYNPSKSGDTKFEKKQLRH